MIICLAILRGHGTVHRAAILGRGVPLSQQASALPSRGTRLLYPTTTYSESAHVVQNRTDCHAARVCINNVCLFPTVSQSKQDVTAVATGMCYKSPLAVRGIGKTRNSFTHVLAEVYDFLQFVFLRYSST